MGSHRYGGTGADHAQVENGSTNVVSFYNVDLTAVEIIQGEGVYVLARSPPRG